MQLVNLQLFNLPAFGEGITEKVSMMRSGYLGCLADDDSFAVTSHHTDETHVERNTLDDGCKSQVSTHETLHLLVTSPECSPFQYNPRGLQVDLEKRLILLEHDVVSGHVVLWSCTWTDQKTICRTVGLIRSSGLNQKGPGTRVLLGSGIA